MTSRATLRAAALQFPVRMSVGENLADLAAALGRLEPGMLVVAPEGCLSGYEPRPDFVSRLDVSITGQAIERARRLAVETRIHLVIGACIQEDGTWFNATFYMGPNREIWRYDKINLARSERDAFTPGNCLPVHDKAV